MTRSVGFTQASLTRAINGARRAGLFVTAIKADGTVLVSDTPVDPKVFRIQAGDCSSPYEDTRA